MHRLETSPGQVPGTGGSGTRGLARGVVGSARVIAFGTSNVAPAGAVVGGLIIIVSYAGFASPLVVLVAFVAALCCASSIGEFARRLPSAGSLCTYNSRGLGVAAGFLTGWMMVFTYVLYVPAGISLTSAYGSALVADTLHVTVSEQVLFVIILAAAILVAYLGIGTSSWTDMVLVAGEVAVIAALAITILLKTGPAHYSAAVLSPASSPHRQLTDLTDAMIYGTTAFAGFEAAAALGEEARDTRRSVPASTISVVIVTGAFYLLVVVAEMFGVGRDGIGSFAGQRNPLGYLTSHYWYLAGAGGLSVVLIYLAVNIATIRAFRTEFRSEFRVGRHLLIPATAAVLFLFPLWGILHPRGGTLMDLLPFTALAWLGVGVVGAGILRAQRPESFAMLGQVFMPAEAAASGQESPRPG